MARRRYRAEERDEDLEDNLPDEAAENEDPDEHAEDEDDRTHAEDDDPDEQAEDDNPDEAAEDEDPDEHAEDEEEPRSRKAKAGTLKLKERKRCTGLTLLARQAKKLGVSFNASRAIANGTSLGIARARVLKAAADADAKLRVSAVSTGGSRGMGRHTRAAKKQMWKAAKARARRK